MPNRRELNIIENPDFLNPYRVRKNNSERNYQVLVEDAPDLIFTTDMEGNFLYANKLAQDIFKIPATKPEKKNLLNIAAPEYQKEIKDFYKSIRRKKHLPLLEIEATADNGRQIPLEIHLKPIKNNKGIVVSLLGIARNYSERKKIEQAFHESIEKYSAIVEKAKDGVVIVQDGICMYANQAAAEISGYTQKELIGKPIFEKLATKDKDLVEKKYQKRSADKKVPPVYVIRILDKNKKEKTVEISESIIQYEGQPADLALIRDLTDRKSISNKMKEMNRQIERFAQITAALVLVEDAEDFLDYVAQAVIDISDFNRVLISYFKDDPPYREILGHKGVTKKDLARIRKVEMPREKYLKYFEQGIKIGNQTCYIPHNLKEILDQKAVLYGKKSYPTGEGSWHREDNLLVTMKDAVGQVIGIISIDDSKSGRAPTAETVRPLEIFANLISEMIQRRILAKKIKESEEKYRDLITNIKVGIFRMNPGGYLLEANPAAVEMFGYEDMARFLNHNIVDFFQQQDLSTEFLTEMDNNGLVKNQEYCLKKKDGSPFWASITSTAIKRNEGKLHYYDTVIEDITRKKELQEDVRRLSITDELTGLFNRRYFNQNLPKEIKTAERWRSTLSLIMIDIDDFKLYNDSYHHLKGDELLKELAQVISINIRREKNGNWCTRFDDNGTSIGDWASRFGGDEFTIILPGADEKEAIKVGERIRSAFQQLKLKPAGTVIQKTISLGIAFCSYKGKKGTKAAKSQEKKTDYERVATQLINLADAALYTAKSTGRNKIEISQKTITLSR
jgi:diguanylate cyclase (GGDEF)-like protein/PAS domain S-box-containing protein